MMKTGRQPQGLSAPYHFWAQGYRKNQVYKIKTPTGVIYDPPKGRCWGATESEFEKLKADGRIYWPKNGNGRPRVIPETGKEKTLVPNTLWLASEVGDTEGSKKELMEIFSERDELGIHAPKPVELLERIIHISTKEDSIILDSFAGSGTTAHAVLAANNRDGGHRRFILVECEGYADSLTAERVRRVINGYKFKGNQREELYSEKITWSTFSKKSQAILEKVESIERFEGAAYDNVKKETKDGVLKVIGERAIKETAPGIGGSFTYCTLGEPINIESLLTGKDMPSYEALARYVFYTATGQSIETLPTANPTGFVAESELFRVHLIYKPDKAWLRSNEAALKAELVEMIEKENVRGKRAVVFAVAKFMSQKELTKRRIEFCQLPYAVHRILGD